MRPDHLPKPLVTSKAEPQNALIVAERPDYAVLFPDWYPRSVKKEIFEPVHRVILKENVICGGDEMVVYKLNWEGFDELEESARRSLEPGGRSTKGGGG